MTTYCEYCNTHPEDSYNKNYHDTQYGFPIDDDNELFERLVLEINQAGLSWITILKKADNFRKAYHGFKIAKVAKYTEADRERLLADAGIIRNRLKVNAAIVNAQKIIELQKEHGSFKSWLDVHHPLTKDEWTKLFKRTFVFTGGEIVNEFLMSTGYLLGAHQKDCPIFKKVAAKKPAWMKK
ncbi:MAG: DNA-3-methyladenine glycosylase I [Anaerolineales bacterium]|nr:DNA-3-methyladenine glycosylase I [Anaerolineales bacterium]MCB9145253.1 DNA-3-methyladenine glycosylase I [Anaerolineales bacterium]